MSRVTTEHKIRLDPMTSCEKDASKEGRVLSLEPGARLGPVSLIASSVSPWDAVYVALTIGIRGLKGTPDGRS